MRKIGLGLAAVVLAACAHKDIDNKDAVRAAVMDYLNARQSKTGIDMSTMDVDVTEMRFEKDTARASVAFRIKGGDAGMNMSYNLDRKGDKWVVRPRTDADNPHGTAIPPSGIPPSGGDGTLPAGHPAVGSKE